MNLEKHLEYFDPVNDVKGSVHVIGVGAMGSRIAELLVRLGLEKIHIWDMDRVESKNITNQAYLTEHVGRLKNAAMREILESINPRVQVSMHDEWKGNNLNGYVFLCVDSIELRKQIVKQHMTNFNVKAMFDTRMRLEDAQSYGAKWDDANQREAFYNSMDFTDEEAEEATPVSACGTTLSVAPTIFVTTAVTVSNFLNLIRKGECTSMILVDAFNFTMNNY